MSNSADEVMDLIFGRWRSQILYAGAELGIFDHLDKAKPKKADVLAVEMGVDPNHLYRPSDFSTRTARTDLCSLTKATCCEMDIRNH